MSKPKKINPSRDREKAMTLLQRSEYAHFFSNCALRPASQPFLEQLAIDLITWLDNNPDKLQIIGFLKERGIFPATIREWTKRNESLKNAYNWAMYTLGQRREEGAIRKEFDSSFVRYTMPMFDEDFKALEEWRSKLKDENQEGGTKIVVLEKFPETNIPKAPEREG